MLLVVIVVSISGSRTEEIGGTVAQLPEEQQKSKNISEGLGKDVERKSNPRDQVATDDNYIIFSHRDVLRGIAKQSPLSIQFSHNCPTSFRVEADEGNVRDIRCLQTGSDRCNRIDKRTAITKGKISDRTAIVAHNSNSNRRCR